MKKQTFRAKIKDGVLTLQNKFAFNNAVKECPDGEYDLVLCRHYNKASNLQFGYLYGLVYPLSIQALIQSGEEEFKTVEQVDQYWKYKFANKEVLDRQTGEIMKLPLSKSEFKTIDEMAYCDQIRTFCAEWLDYHIPEADPEYKKKLKDNKPE